MKLTEITKKSFVSNLRGEHDILLRKIDAFNRDRNNPWGMTATYRSSNERNDKGPYFHVIVSVFDRDVGTDAESVKVAAERVNELFKKHDAEFDIVRAGKLADGRIHRAVEGKIYIDLSDSE